MSVAVLALLTATLLFAPGPTQQARDQTLGVPKGTGTLTGVVMTRGDAPVPVARAVLSLSGAPLRTSLLAVTDKDGRFVFRDLPAGRFTLDARKGGFVREVYGVPIPVGDGTTDVSLSLVRSAAVAGRILMPPGAPVSSIRLQLLKWETTRGARTLVSARGGAFTLAGDGRYRIGGLPPGDYVVVAYGFGRLDRRQFDAAGGGAVVSMAPVYSPGTTDPTQARAVRVEAGQEQVLDLPMDFVPTGRLEGHVIGPDGVPMRGAQVSVVSGLPAVPTPQPVTTAADGSFVMTALTPGTYTLVARGAPLGTPPPQGGTFLGNQPRLPWWAESTVVVTPGGRMEGVTLALQPARTVRGRIVVSAGGMPVSPAALIVMLAADTSSTTTVGVPVVAPAADGSFEIPGVAPGRYRLQVTLPAVLQDSAFIVGMDAGGTDVLDSAFAVGLDRDVDVSVRLTTQPSELEVEAAGQVVVVMPRDVSLRVPGSRRIAMARAGADGVAVVRGLPDGDYLVAVLPELPDEAARTAEWFAALAATARPVSVREGARVRVGGLP